MLVAICFWLCLGAIIYVYVGYPLLVFLLGRLVGRPIQKEDITPSITVLISAFNEEKEIRDTIINKLEQDYPQDLLKVIVVSDGSTDRTDQIVQHEVARNHSQIQFLRQEPRQGKTQALNLAVTQADSELLVFADANSLYARNALRRLVRNFADPTVGYATGRMVYATPDASGIGEGSGVYMRYENLLRTLETRVGSIVGVDGGIDAVRKSLYTPMRPDQLPDFILPLNVVETGRRVVYDPDAELRELALTDASDEFRMRVRVALRALWALYDKGALLNPYRHPLFSWQLLSHKVLRYFAFLFLLGLLLCNSILIDQHPFYSWFLGLQVVGYVLALLGHLFTRSLNTIPGLLAPYYFTVLNVACALAVWKFLTGHKLVLWKPRGGS